MLFLFAIFHISVIWYQWIFSTFDIFYFNDQSGFIFNFCLNYSFDLCLLFAISFAFVFYWRALIFAWLWLYSVILANWFGVHFGSIFEISRSHMIFLDLWFWNFWIWALERATTFEGMIPSAMQLVTRKYHKL